MQTKTYRVETKATEEEGVIDAYIPMSTASLDRDEEVIQPSAFRKTIPIFMKRPVLVSSHFYGDLRKQIGEFTKMRLTDEGLHAKPKYYVNMGNEEADWAYKLAGLGMAAFSVGFIPKKWDEGDGAKSPRRTYTDVELLEISQVVVPSNREAIQGLRSKAVGVEAELLDKALDLVTKPEPDVTENYIRLRQRDPGDFQEGSFRTITISAEKGIKAVIGKLKGEDTMTVQSYLFDKDKWTVEEARAWVKEHEKAFVVEVEPEMGWVSYPITTNVTTSDYQITTSADYDASTPVNYDTGTVWIGPDVRITAKQPIPSEGDVTDDMDEIVTYFESGGELTIDNWAYAWKMVNAILNKAGQDVPEDIRRKMIPIDVAGAVRSAFAQITGGR
jgi:HK97 family phage prohead protease